MKNKTVFLDRDGTINVEKNYLYKIEDFEFIEGAPEAIKLLNDNGYKIIVITNQAGVARGYYREDDVKKLHNYINDELKKRNAHIDAFYYCPHHPTTGIDNYKVKCKCRKPNGKLYLKAIEDFNVDIEKSFVIGDKFTDLQPGIAEGIKSILVMTGYGKEELNKIKESVICKTNILTAVNHIISLK